MNDQPISRRNALIAATALGAMAAVSRADDPMARQASEFERVQEPKVGAAPTFGLQVTLTDGQVVTLNASKVVMNFADGGALVATPAGVLPFLSKPAAAKQPDRLFDSDPSPFERPRDKPAR